MKKFKGLPLLITCPLIKSFGNIIYKNLYLLYMDQEAQRCFISGAMITFQGARKLSSYLGRAKIYPQEWAVVFLSVTVKNEKIVTLLHKHPPSLAR